jgi:hypothetical protein
MKSKIIALVGGYIALVVVNGAVYGGLLAEYLQEMMARNPEVFHEDLPMIFIGHFVQALLMVALLSRMGVRGAKDGFVAGAWINLGIIAVSNLMTLGFVNLFTLPEALCDVAINGVTGGVGGMAMGYLLGRFSDA